MFCWLIWIIAFLVIVNVEAFRYGDLKLERNEFSSNEMHTFEASKEFRMVAENAFEWTSVLPALQLEQTMQIQTLVEIFRADANGEELNLKDSR